MGTGAKSSETIGGPSNIKCLEFEYHIHHKWNHSNGSGGFGVTYLYVLVPEGLEKRALIIVLVLVEEVLVDDFTLLPHRHSWGDMLTHRVALLHCEQSSKSVRKPGCLYHKSV